MKKITLLIVLLFLSFLSFLLSLLYFGNPEYRKEKINSYKKQIEKRLHKAQ
ncbi:MAG: hypothetical protein ACK4LA_01000 [Aquificaceae bacterium]